MTDEERDNAAVDAFAAAIKTRLAELRPNIRSGWHECTRDQLWVGLASACRTGVLVDVGAFAAFTWNVQQTWGADMTFHGPGPYTRDQLVQHLLSVECSECQAAAMLLQGDSKPATIDLASCALDPAQYEAGSIHSGALAGSGYEDAYVAWPANGYDLSLVTLDGDFSITDLHAIIDHMRAHSGE